jgi:hypothetical protein
MIDIGMINAVTAAANSYKNKNKKQLNPNDPDNLFQIKYSVYNLYDMAYLTPLINAYKAGVFVQVLIHLAEELESYNNIFNTFNNLKMVNKQWVPVFSPSSLKLQTLKTNTQSQRDCTKEQLATLNLIPIDPKGSLMHCKTRYYKFGGVPTPVQIGDKHRWITEAVVTGSFNPECSATANNEYLLVLSTSATTTPATITSYLRIYDFVKHQLAGTKASSPSDLTTRIAPNDNDPIYNINNSLFVCYSGWCQGKYNNTPSYIRYVLADLIDKEQLAIFLPLYSLSNLDAPDKYTNPLVVNDVSNAKITSPELYTKDAGNGPQFFSYKLMLNGLTKALENIGVKGIGAQMEIDYGTKKANYIIRGPVPGEKDSVYLILKGRTQPAGKITKITVYNSILTHFGNARKRKVMVFLMISKYQADGEVANDGTSFTDGDSSLTAFLIQQMGGITWRCQNAIGELHSKSGYFYSQNTLITDTTNWSNAGMGYQGKSGPNCSSVNNETCLVIKGDYLKGEKAKQIFKIRVLANIMNTARMYAYQQPACRVADSTFGGLFPGKPTGFNLNINCECPQASVSCDRTSKTSPKGTCSMITGETTKSSCYMKIGATCKTVADCSSTGSICYGGKTKHCVPTVCGGVASDGQLVAGACITSCCLRYGQTPSTIDWNALTTQIFKLPYWPQISTLFGTKVYKNPLGLIVPAGTSNSYIIDPTFDWAKGTRTSDVELLGYLNPKKGGYFTPSTVKNEKDPKVPPQGNFCARVGPCSKPSKQSTNSNEEFIYTRAGVY